MKKSILFVVFVFSVSLIVSISGCAPASTPVATALPEQVTIEDPDTVAEVEQLAGFDVREPGYLPPGVSLRDATFETTPSPAAVLQFTFVHEQYGDMGRLFELRQEPQTQAPPGSLSCRESVEGCEVLQVGDVPVVYHLYPSPEGEGISTELMEWYADGFFFRLHRMAGEPNKIYREELLNVVGSMK